MKQIIFQLKKLLIKAKNIFVLEDVSREHKKAKGAKKNVAATIIMDIKMFC